MNELIKLTFGRGVGIRIYASNLDEDITGEWYKPKGEWTVDFEIDTLVPHDLILLNDDNEDIEFEFTDKIKFDMPIDHLFMDEETPKTAQVGDDIYDIVYCIGVEANYKTEVLLKLRREVK